jgi:hypothetical protein
VQDFRIPAFRTRYLTGAWLEKNDEGVLLLQKNSRVFGFLK